MSFTRNATRARSEEGQLFLQARCSVTPLFLGRSLPFLIFSVILKNKKNLDMGSFNYFSYTIQIVSNWCMDTAVHDLEVAFFRLILPDLMTCVAKIYQIDLYMLC